MKKLVNWTIRRSGASLTIKGYGPDGEEVTLFGVASVGARNSKAIVADKNGDQWDLIL